MIKMLTHFILFECGNCRRFWNYKEFKNHKLQGKCVKDSSAQNNVANLSLQLHESKSNPIEKAPPAKVSPTPAVQQPTMGSSISQPPQG